MWHNFSNSAVHMYRNKRIKIASYWHFLGVAFFSGRCPLSIDQLLVTARSLTESMSDDRRWHWIKFLCAQCFYRWTNIVRTTLKFNWQESKISIECKKRVEIQKLNWKPTDSATSGGIHLGISDNRWSGKLTHILYWHLNHYL